MADGCWYVIQTKPKREDAVAWLLSRANFPVFLPRMRRVERVWPLFPRYCFCQADLRDAAVHHLVRFTRGVTRVLGDEVGPVSVAHDIIRTIRQVTADGSLIEQELLFRPGDRVMVRGGILRDLIGIVTKHLSEEGRVRVLFTWLTRRVQYEVDYRCIEKVA